MRVDEFDFELPSGLIAQRPIVPRDAARLLHLTPEALVDRRVRDLPALLRSGDLLVFNDTRVVPARLAGHRRGVAISVTLHRRIDPRSWWVFAKPGKRLRVGDEIAFAADFGATVRQKDADGAVLLEFDRGGDSLSTAFGRYGAMPLPPYIRHGVADARDEADYQTVFASREGAVAAPTAALHFTPELVAALASRGIEHRFVTLHVGAGTFLPVRVADTEDHRMHTEWGEVGASTAAAIAAVRERGGRIVAVGTTSLRLIESATRAGRVEPFRGTTDLFITPGYRFRGVDLLITNFHLPRSTLFMLVAAFAGLERIKIAYAHAIRQGYRFYSYGDCCLLEPARAA